MAISQQQIDQTVRHAVFLERLKTGQVNKFAPFLKRIDKEVRLQLSAHDLTDFSRTRLNKLLREVDSLLAVIYKEFTDELQGDLFELAVYEAGFEARSLGAVVNAEFNLPNENQLIAAVKARPLSIRGSGKLLEPWIEDWSKQEKARVSEAIRQGYYEGQTTNQILQRVRGTRANKFNDGILAISNRHAETVVRTAVQHVATVARHEMFAANEDIIEGYQWIATLDSRTSSQCRSLDGQIFKTGKGPLPPLHPNCLVGDSLVLSRSGISNASKRWFEGEIIVLRTATGRKLSCTPNHPILTPKGWIAAGLLNERSSIVCDGGSEWVAGGNRDNQRGPTKIKHVAESLLSKPEVFAVEVPVAAPHFHGDGAGSKVAVVGANSLLRSHGNAFINKHGPQFFLDRTIKSAKALFGLGPPALLSKRMFSSFDGAMRSARQFFPFFGRRSGHSSELLFSPISGFDAAFFKNSTDDAWGDPEAIRYTTHAYSVVKKALCFIDIKLNARLKAARAKIDPCFFENAVDGGISEAKIASDLVCGRSGPVFFDDIVSVRRDKFSGHVYNLETGNHVYSANGILTHNCRSSTIPEISAEFDFLKEGRTRASKDGPVVDQSYYQWLKKQPKSFQDDAIGKTRGKLLRNGGLSAEQFARLNIDKNFAPLTLKEMRDREPLAFLRAGL